MHTTNNINYGLRIINVLSLDIMSLNKKTSAVCIQSIIRVQFSKIFLQEN